jgi:hypothetical protein
LNENTIKVLRNLGADFISFTPNWKVVQKLMLQSFLEKGDFCWHCHTGIYSYPMHVALQQQVPLIFWGEPSSEYTAYYDYRDDKIEEVDEEKFNRSTNLGITAEDMAGMISGDFDFDPRDFKPFSYPPLRDLKKLGYRSVCLGSYIPWDVKRQVGIIQNELGWQGDQVEGIPWNEYPYEKIECHLQGVRDYIKYLKRGYSRVTQMTALDLRNGRITQDSARKMIDQYEGLKPPSLTIFLEYLGISEDEFNNFVAKTVVPPYTPNFNADYAPKTSDFDLWYREPEDNLGIRLKIIPIIKK